MTERDFESEMWNFHFPLLSKIFILGGGFPVDNKSNREKKLPGKISEQASTKDLVFG